MPEVEVFITDYTIADELDIEEEILSKVPGAKFVRAQCDTEEQVLEAVKMTQPEAVAGIVTQWAPVTAKVMDNFPNLKVVSRNGIGVDNIDLDYCKEKGIAVTNSPQYCTPEVADHAMSLVLALVRKLIFTTDKVRAGEWGSDYLIPIRRMSELTMGVIGMGGIGRAVTQRARPFFKEVVGYDAYAKDVVVDDKPVRMLSLDELLAEADVIDLHVPGTPETTHLINAETIAKMKDGVYIVNTCRGVVINTEALVEGLKSGKIGGAGLDVFEQEPLPTDHPLYSMDHVIITPHAAFYSEEAVDQVRADTIINIVALINDEEPVNRVL